MTVKIIASLVIALIFFIFYKAGTGLLEKDNLLSKLFPLGSIVLTLFFISLIFSS